MTEPVNGGAGRPGGSGEAPAGSAPAGRRIGLSHGDGGLATRRLVEEVFLSRFRHPALHALGDSAVLDWEASRGGRLAFTTDAFVVEPAFFPGGDIGRLAVCGTVNDLAVAGASPWLISAAFVLEEGLPVSELESIADSMASAAEEAGVSLVAGDTKVVQHGRGDGCYITTGGVGVIPPGLELGPHLIRPGDLILINGGLGEHGLAVLSRRPGLAFDTPVKSDCAPLNGLIRALLQASRVRFMRDPTRGGVATVLLEAAAASGLPLLLEEEALPVSPAVRAGVEVLGLDPLYLANEGKVVAVVPASEADAALSALRGHPLGREACVIGRVLEAGEAPDGISRGARGRTGGVLLLRTALGPVRRLSAFSGEPLPRIC
ncbi:MAG: hydrogenase expression/formation protein HypE [Acetobacteraceae bacterium]|nr:hydrogenase expression/formation protein HypE [Acetobacteraceae bacterium]